MVIVNADKILYSFWLLWLRFYKKDKYLQSEIEIPWFYFEVYTNFKFNISNITQRKTIKDI